MKGKNPAYKNVNSMTYGGCKCGCARQTTSNIPDPTKQKQRPKKRIIQYKRKPIKIIA